MDNAERWEEFLEKIHIAQLKIFLAGLDMYIAALKEGESGGMEKVD